LAVSANTSAISSNDVFRELATNPDTAWLSPGTNPSQIADKILIDRYIWLTATKPAASGAGPTINNTFYLRDGAPSPALKPGGYLVIGPRQTTYLGSGKVEELRELCEAVDADTVVFDNELSPAQQRNLEKLLGRSAIDRTAVILDIFGQNAHSLEGKAQVELAQIRYRLPRLRGKGNQLSRQGGGIGARQGGGETQLEVDRRRLQRRMHKLEGDLREISRVRDTQAKSRQRSRLHRVAIVGYTNAGKSTLLNHLTDAGVLVEDRLFATLDATTRRLQLPGGEAVLLTDTVGFITKLPTQLVEAFKSTLEVVVDADLLVHVIDGSAADPESNI
jgi:GTP-binding protein HflX